MTSVSTKTAFIGILAEQRRSFFAEQKRLYSGYKASREEMVALLIAKQNADRILNGSLMPAKNIERDAR